MFQKIELKPIHPEPKYNILKGKQLAAIGLTSLSLLLGLPQCSGQTEQVTPTPIASPTPEAQTAVPSATTTATATTKFETPTSTATATTEVTKTATAKAPNPSETPRADGVYVSQPINKETTQFENKLTLEEIEKLQADYLANGELKIPLPQELIDKEGTVRELKTSGSALTIQLAPGEKTTIPALISGKVTYSTLVSGYMRITIDYGSGNIKYNFPRTNKILVHKGDIITLGQPICEITNNPDDPDQTVFQKQGVPLPNNTVMFMYRADVNDDYINLSLDNLLKQDSKNVTIPTQSQTETSTTTTILPTTFSPPTTTF